MNTSPALSVRAGNLAACLRPAAGYAGAGLTGTLCHYLVLMVCVSGFGLPVLPATAAGALAGALVNYVLNHRLVFRSMRRHREALPRFLAVAAVGMLVNLLVVAALMNISGVHYLLAQFAATVSVFITGFLLNRHWTFQS